MMALTVRVSILTTSSPNNNRSPGPFKHTFQQKVS